MDYPEGHEGIEAISFIFVERNSKERYGKAVPWFFDQYGKEVQRLLIMPFDIHCGNTLY